MAAFTEENEQSILETCGKNSAALAESLSQCFERGFRIAAGESRAWSGENQPAEIHGPGILVLIEVESQALAVLIPQTLPLPEWYRQPNERQAAQLKSLALEWSRQLIPAAVQSSQCNTLAVDNLAAAAMQMHPADQASALTMQVSDATTSEDTAGANLVFVWPFERTKVATTANDVASAARVSLAPASLPKGVHDPLARLRRLPVQVSVRLVEKKIPLSNLLGITPGMLIPFSKSCDDLLDLFVNNSRYCRGEAVKIGENFGLKINQIGVADAPPRKVIDTGV